MRAFYDEVSSASLRLDNELQFPSELVSHIDGPLVDRARNKLLFMFHNPVAGVSVGKKAMEAEPTMAAGLLAGDDKVRSRLAEEAKADQLTIADPWFWLLPSIHPSFLDIYLNQMLELKLELSAHFTLTFKLCGHFSVRVFINIVLGTCVLHLCAILSLCY